MDQEFLWPARSNKMRRQFEENYGEVAGREDFGRSFCSGSAGTASFPTVLPRMRRRMWARRSSRRWSSWRRRIWAFRTNRLRPPKRRASWSRC